MMMRLLLPVLAILCCGFTIVTDEMIAEREKLCDRIRARYTEDALTAFVKKVSIANPEVDGISLANASVEQSWHTMDWNPFWHVISGDWAMAVEEHGWWVFTRIDRFTMFWACEKEAGIFIRGHRDRSGRIILDSITKEETVELNWL